MKATRPYLSVIVPVHECERMLVRSLHALVASELPRQCWELIVVDDASSDETARVACPYADLLIRLTGAPRGPGYARNRGAERARGECLVFFDADVLVRPDTLGCMAGIFATCPDVAAVFGAYDDSPADPGLVSQYRNLLHHFTHSANPGDAHTFWAGCGAVRRECFMEAGMYDEWRFPRPQVEDIELGHRIRAAGHRIVLHPELQVTHMKRWTLATMISADFNDRGVPWARLLAESHSLLSPAEERANVLNLRWREKFNTVLVWLALILVSLAVLSGDASPAFAAAAALAAVLWSNRPLYRVFRRRRGVVFALSAVPLHLLYYIINGLSVAWGWTLATVVGEPRPDPSVEAFAEIGVETWPPVPANPKRSARPVILPAHSP